MSRKGSFDIKVKFEHEPILDTNIKDIDELDDVFNNLKRKFK